MMLTLDEKRKRRQLLQRWYEEGFRYVVRTKYDTLHRGTAHKGKMQTFGTWRLESSTSLTKEERNLFPDVKWRNKNPLDIEAEIKEMDVN